MTDITNNFIIKHIKNIGNYVWNHKEEIANYSLKFAALYGFYVFVSIKQQQYKMERYEYRLKHSCACSNEAPV